MKTNASPKSVIKAVETVSATQFNNNVVFMNYPKKITKYVCRFTLRTKDVNGPGSMITKAGQKQPKANLDVQLAVMEEILRINPYPNIYVDTVLGRKFSNGQNDPNEVAEQADNLELEEVHEEQQEQQEPAQATATAPTKAAPRTKRQYRKKDKTRKVSPKGTGIGMSQTKLVNALKYVLAHPELLNKK